MKKREQAKKVMVAERLKQAILTLEGIDDLSLAQYLALDVAETLQKTAWEILSYVNERHTQTPDILSEIDFQSEFVKHAMSIFQKNARDFEAYCAGLRGEETE